MMSTDFGSEPGQNRSPEQSSAGFPTETRQHDRFCLEFLLETRGTSSYIVNNMLWHTAIKNFRLPLLVAVLAFSTFVNERNASGAIPEDVPPAALISGFRAPWVSEKIEYYSIDGASEKELVCQLQEKGCHASDGRTYDSVTRWHITWDYDYDRTERGCAAEDFKASVDITYRFPLWLPADTAPESLIENWSRYIMNLELHERGHRDMAVDAAMVLSQDIANLPPFERCRDLDRAISSLVRDRTAKLNASSVSYDDTTSHGSTQGASFP